VIRMVVRTLSEGAAGFAIILLTALVIILLFKH
jgi:hypothetical protein